MTRAQLLIGQGCWLDDKRAPLRCHRVDDGGLTPTSYCYARVVVRLLEVLASYVGRPNLMVIMSGMILKRLGAW